MPIIDEMVQEVARAAGIAPEAAALAVTSMLRLMAARLPSPLFGELQARLALPPAVADAPPVPGGADPS